MTQSPDLELYPDEFRKIALAMTKLESAFEFSVGFNERQRAEFDAAAREEFAKIGIEINVNWKQVYKQTPLGEYPTGVWMPGVEPYARTRPESETDHDRIQWGTVKGLADGQPGYVRADGTKHEEPIKKLIL